ncbi:MAG: hypothetical protein KAS32_05420 [Candidatus Peribacteraceae bacterium]|nr:hypothetical protein [Candidatus Peribacteraceae bacterium]
MILSEVIQGINKMGCCGKNVKRNKPPVDKRGNSLRKVAFLHPHQKRILEAEDNNITEEEEIKE